MFRKTVVVERADGYGTTMSPQGIGELYKSIVAASPEIKGIIVTVNEDCEFPSTYRVREVDDISDFSG